MGLQFSGWSQLWCLQGCHTSSYPSLSKAAIIFLLNLLNEMIVVPQRFFVSCSSKFFVGNALLLVSFLVFMSFCIFLFELFEKGLVNGMTDLKEVDEIFHKHPVVFFVVVQTHSDALQRMH